MSRDRDRFVRELVRLAEFRVAFVVVEASLDTVLTTATSKMSPASRAGTLTAWWMRYPSVQWIFINGARRAARLAIRVFRRHVDDLAKTTTETAT